MKWLAAGLVSAVVLSSGVAQAAPGLEPGARVRVTLLERKAEPFVGTLLSLPSGTIEFQDSLAHSVPRADVAKLELSRGMKSNAGKGATIGALAGAVVLGLSVASVASADGTSDDTVLAGIAGGVVGALGGAVLGALIGSASKHERWEEVPAK